MNISFREMSPKEQKLVIEEVTTSIIAIKALMIGDYKKYEKYSNKSLEYYKKLSNYLKVEKVERNK